MEYKHANEFDKHRDWLLDCSDKGIGYINELMQESVLKNLLKDAEYRLLYAQKILQRNIIPISLFAQSQTGKSTSTAAMVDGRNISPRGKGGGGLRTTAVPVTLYHDPDKTGVEIALYSPEELVDQVLECAGANLDDARQEPYDLDNPKDVELLWKALEDEIDLYRGDSGYSLTRQALLRRALLIVNFYGCEACKKLYTGEITEDEVNKCIAFGSDPDVCWKRLRERGIDLLNDLDEDGYPLFGQMENLHVFIRSITRPVNSEFMKETGTAVIDAPGIKMSVEDTRRALKCASEAAVVLYLLDGEHQLTQEDKETLRTLRDAGLADKVIFAVNYRRSVEAVREAGVEKSLLSSIEEAGFTAPQHKQLLYYHALLALFAAQGRLILNGELDVATENQIRMEAGHTYPKMRDKFAAMDVEKIWEYMVRKLLTVLNEDEAEEMLSEEGLCESTLLCIRKASRWDDAVQKLRDFVLENRASGVLRDLGAQPICDVLTTIEDGLSMCEQNALRSEDDMKQEYDKAKELLDKYSEKVEGVIADHLDSDMDAGLADDYIDSVLLGAVADTAKDAAESIYEENGLMNNMRIIGAKAVRLGQKAVNAVGSWFGKDELVHVKKVESVKERCAAIVKTNYETNIATLHTKWNAALESKEVYKKRVKRPVERVMKEMEYKWEELGLNQNNLIGKTPALPVRFTGNLSKDAVNIRRMYDELSGRMNVPVNIPPSLTGWLAGAGAMGGLYFIYMFLLPVDFVIPGFGTIMTIVALAVMTLVNLLSDNAKQKQIQQIQDELEKSIRAEISVHKSEIKANVIAGTQKEPGLRCVREFYAAAFDMTIQHQRKELEKRYQEIKDMLAAHAAERARIAALAKEWREEKITPLREEINGIIDEINRIWN